MKKNIAILMILFFCSHQLSFGQMFYVAKNGNDSNPGTKNKPVATLEAAKFLVRNFKKKIENSNQKITVIINRGQYDLSKGFVLNEEDGGKPGNEITWVAGKNEKVSITGGKSIPYSNFKKVTDKNIIERVGEKSAQNILEVNLSGLGILNYGEIKQIGFSLAVVPMQLELFFNGAPMTLARYPNTEFIKIGKVIDKGSVPRTLEKENRGGKFEYADLRHSKWKGQEDIWLKGTFNTGYADDLIKIDSIDDINKTIKLASPHLYGINSGKEFQHYYAINILDEIDSPGEYYIDRKTGMLYFWPPSTLEHATIQVSLLEEPIVSLNGVSNIKLKGLTIETGRQIGIYMERGENNSIVGCTIRNVGNIGIVMGVGALKNKSNMSIDDFEGTPISGQIGDFTNFLYANNNWNRLAGKNHKIISSDVYYTGCGGINLSGGDKTKLINGNNVVENCKVHDYNRNYSFTWAGINVDGCGNKISHCEIYNSDFQGIFVHGNEHIFEFNNIHHVTLDSDDTSPWYIGRNPSDRGNIVRYNYFHHCGNPKKMNMGIYCDDSSTGVEVFGNVFYEMKTNHGVLFSNTGWDLKMTNNIVINPLASTAQISAHYYSWYKGGEKYMFAPNGLLEKRMLKEIKFNEPPYSIKYPSLLTYLDRTEDGRDWEGMRTRNNVLSQNVILGGPANPISLLGGEYATISNENNYLTNEDPGFVDMQKGNFMLKENSLVFKKLPGFKPIPFNKMGLYKDEYRK